MLLSNEMKNKHIILSVAKSYHKIVERVKLTTLAHTYMTLAHTYMTLAHTYMAAY